MKPSLTTKSGGLAVVVVVIFSIFFSALGFTVLFSTVLFSTLLFSAVLFSTVLSCSSALAFQRSISQCRINQITCKLVLEQRGGRKGKGLGVNPNHKLKPNTEVLDFLYERTHSSLLRSRSGHEPSVSRPGSRAAAQETNPFWATT